MKLRIAGIIPESVVDGPGLRSVIFTQGCPRHCKNCHNPDTQDINGGQELEIEDIISKIDAVKLVSGITISGGEPFLQSTAVGFLTKYYKARGYNVMVYTGYTWEELLSLAVEQKEIHELLENCDYVVDGPFIEAQKDLNLPFRGSKNQRIVDVQATLRENKIVNAPFA